MTKAKWTVMIYMAGDNTLSQNSNTDIEEMREVGSSDAVNIVVLCDGFGSSGAAQTRIEKDGKREQIEALKEINSGDPKTLVKFADWASEKYPAEQYGLILWSHGSGWQPHDIKQIAQQVNTLNFDQQERSTAGLGRAFFRPTIEEILQLPSSNERAICMDDLSGSALDTVQLGWALKKISEALQQKLDLLGMDACLMSNFEVAFQIHPFANYMVASEEVEPDYGWSYKTVLQRLVNNPDLPAIALAQTICQSYVGGREKKVAKTLTALNLAKASEIADQLSVLAQHLTPQISKHRFKLWNALQRATAFEQFTLWDIAHLCEELSKEALSDPLPEAATTLRAMLGVREDGFVVGHKSNDARLATCGGVSVYIPAPPEIDLSRYYGKLEFAQKTNWLDFLTAVKT